MDDKRIRRPEVERTEPLRSWSGMVDSSSGPTGDPSRPFEQDVTMGYRVIDEFMRRGAAAARDVSKQFLAPADPRVNTAMVERLFQSASDLGGVWLEMMQSLWLTQSEPAQRQDANAFDVQPTAASRAVERSAPEPADPPSPPTPPTRLIVAFRVQSGRPVELSAAFDPKAGSGPFVVHPLRALDPELKCIAEVTFVFESERSHALATLEIDAEHAPAIYTGMIVHAQTHLPAGSITVHVLP